MGTPVKNAGFRIAWHTCTGAVTLAVALSALGVGPSCSAQRASRPVDSGGSSDAPADFRADSPSESAADLPGAAVDVGPGEPGADPGARDGDRDGAVSDLRDATPIGGDGGGAASDSRDATSVDGDAAGSADSCGDLGHACATDELCAEFVGAPAHYWRCLQPSVYCGNQPPTCACLHAACLSSGALCAAASSAGLICTIEGPPP